MKSTDTPSPQPPPLEPTLPENLEFKTLFEALLRNPQALIDRLKESKNRSIEKFALLAIISFTLFGLVLGCFAKHEQLWAAPLKLTMGLIFSGLICFPSLYIFASLAGAKVSIYQLASYLAGAIALAGLLLLGFAPAVWIFTESTDSLGFIGTLALGAWFIAFSFALRFLKLAVSSTGSIEKNPISIWSGVFLLVTLQMTTSLRPILGRAETLFPHEKKFFAQHWFDSIGETLESNTQPNPSTEKAMPTNLDRSKNPYLQE